MYLTLKLNFQFTIPKFTSTYKLILTAVKGNYLSFIVSVVINKSSVILLMNLVTCME